MSVTNNNTTQAPNAVLPQFPQLYEVERSVVEGNSWDRRVKYVIPLIMLLIALYCFMIYNQTTPIVEREDVDAHKALIYIAKTSRTSIEEVFFLKETEDVRREECSTFLVELKQREEAALEKSRKISDTAFSKLLDSTSDVDDSILQDLLNAPHFSAVAQRENSRNVQQSHLFAAVAKDTVRYMEHGYGKKAFDSGFGKEDVEKLGCSFVLQNKYPGRLCISPIANKPVDEFIRNLLMDWFGAVDQRESIEEYCESFFNQTYPLISNRLKKASHFYQATKTQIKCPTPFERVPVDN